MNTIVNIPTPCSENWAAMSSEGRNKHCKVCNTRVHDFSNSSLSEINKVICTDKKICGYYHERHTNNTKKVYVISNAIDNTFSKTRLKKISLIVISMMLLLAGCARRRTMGAVVWSGAQKVKKPHVEQLKI